MSYSQYLRGKAIQTGCDWSLVIKITSAALETFSEDATFAAHVRPSVDGELLVGLTTADGHIVRSSSDTIELSIDGATTENWTVKSVVMDIIRTDGTAPVHLGFDLEIPVKRTITRL